MGIPAKLGEGIMGSVNVFDGKEDVLRWLLKIKAKLISKGYKSVLMMLLDQEL